MVAIADADPTAVASEAELASLCAALGAAEVPGSGAAERRLAAATPAPPGAVVDRARALIAAGHDPLGEAFCRLRPAARRRRRGATYTPPPMVAAMLDWCRGAAAPARVVDPGAGSGRFLLAAAARFPEARLVGVELDPLAALTARANLAAAGLATRSRIAVADYRDAELGAAPGSTLFVGNPPYVRHHHIARRWKRWLSDTAAASGLPASQLAGLHVHFLVATLRHGRRGDTGCFVTAAEWLDVNYGELARRLLAGPLGLLRLDLIDPSALPFSGAQTTAAIVGFRIGAERTSIALRRVASSAALAPLAGGRAVDIADLDRPRWSGLARRRRSRPRHLIELGELCRVHRGQVTGANRVWIAGADTPALPEALLLPTVTRARELFAAAPALVSCAELRRVIALPDELDALAPSARRAVEAFLEWARSRGADRTYVARHRRPWWAVKLRDPAPVLATYMARRPPAFVRNLAGARHINIAHGIYPCQPMSPAALDALAGHLGRTATIAAGRTYAGGLTKFEPREMERLWVPHPDALGEPD